MRFKIPNSRFQISRRLLALALSAPLVVWNLEFGIPAAHAAVGDRRLVCGDVAAGAYLDTLTTGTVVRDIFNVQFEHNVEISVYDGSTTMVFMANLIGPDFQNFFPAGLVATSTTRIRIKNLHASTTKRICYDYVEVNV